VTPATTEIQLANEYAEGFISIRETTGQGQIRKIKSHPSAASADPCVLTLYDPWTTAITSAEQADLVHNPQYKVTEVATGTTILVPAGIPLLSVTASYYFWNQTWGIATVLQDGNCPLGSMVTQGTVAGTVQEFATATNDINGFDWGIMGVQAILGVDTKFSVIMLKIYP
jgi:hypothetical protein